MKKKLIRDKVPDIAKQNGDLLITEVIENDQDFQKELKAKLLEEAQEVVSATTKTELLEEIADLQEVIDTLCTLNNIDSSDLTQKQKSKREKAGGFQKKLLLIGRNEQLFSE